MRTRGSPEEEWAGGLTRERYFAAYNGLSTSEAAEFLGLSAAEVTRLRKAGVLHAVNIREPGKRPQYKFLRSELDFFRGGGGKAPPGYNPAVIRTTIERLRREFTAHQKARPEDDSALKMFAWLLAELETADAKARRG